MAEDWSLALAPFVENGAAEANVSENNASTMVRSLAFSAAEAPQVNAPVPDSGAAECRKIKKLKAEASELRSEIGSLRASMLESLVPSVICPCFSSEGRGIVDPAAAGTGCSFTKDSVHRYLDCVRHLNKKRRLETEDCSDAVAKVADFLVDLVADARSEQLLSVWLHQAVDFVKKSFSSSGSSGANTKIIDTTVKLITKVSSYAPERNPSFDHRQSTLKVMLHLAEVPILGQNLLLQVSKELISIAQALLHADLLRQGVSQLLENAYFLLDFVDKVCEKLLSSWVRDGCINQELVEAFVSDFFEMRAVAIHGSSNQLCLLLVAFADRICAQIVRQLNGVGDQLAMQNLVLFLYLLDKKE